MSDTSDHPSKSIPAILAFAVLALFTTAMLGVFGLIAFQAKVEPVMLGVLGGILTAVQSAMSTALGFWLGSSQGAKAANASLAQLAGSGPQPPNPAETAKG